MEMCALKEQRDTVTTQELNAKLSEFDQKFEVLAECEQSELERAAYTAVAMDKERLDVLPSL